GAGRLLRPRAGAGVLERRRARVLAERAPAVLPAHAERRAERGGPGVRDRDAVRLPAELRRGADLRRRVEDRPDRRGPDGDREEPGGGGGDHRRQPERAGGAGEGDAGREAGRVPGGAAREGEEEA